MTKTQYADLGYHFPECEVSCINYGPDDPKLVTIRHKGKQDEFTVEIAGQPTIADILFVLFEEAQQATMYLRDFVKDWGDRTWCGRREAIREWRRLRHQRRRLKALFGDECP